MRVRLRRVVAIALLVVPAALVPATSPQVTSAGTVEPCADVANHCAKISMTLSGNGQGWYRTDDGFINCVRSGGSTSGSCTHTYDLSGGPIPWGNTYGSETNSCYVNGDTCITGATGIAGFLVEGTVSAGSLTFRLNSPVTVSVKKSGTGGGTVTSTPRGIKCGSDCKSDYPKGETLQLKAAASSGSDFIGWGTTGPCAGQGTTCSFKPGNGPITISAVFDKKSKGTATPAATEAPTEPPPTDGPTAVVPTPPRSIAGTPPPEPTGPLPTGGPAHSCWPSARCS